MNEKIEELISKGYDKDIVLSLSNYNEEDLEYAIKKACELLSYNVIPVDKPKCIYIGGQPGSGKSVLSSKLKNKSNSVEISLDACRMFHPYYEEIEKLINEFYKENKITNENNPGNDIAALTTFFAGNMADRLIDVISDMKYNILLEWNMRKADDVLICMKKLTDKGYSNEGIVVSVNKKTSLEACKIRADIMNSYGHIARRVSDKFHQLCLDTIPLNVDKIYINGTRENILDKMIIVDRNGKIMWNSKMNNGLPSVILKEDYNEVHKYSLYKNDSSLAHIAYKNESLGFKYKNKKTRK